MSAPVLKTTQPRIKLNEETVKKQIDTNFINALNRFIQIAKRNNIKLFFVESPNVNGIEIKNKSNEMIEEIIQKSSVPFIEFADNKNFIGKYPLFNDDSHLNNNGAILFSELLSDSIHNRINTDNKLYNVHAGP